ncbi:hypothetical protein ACS0TY_030074 [Phlomoides rotata]
MNPEFFSGCGGDGTGNRPSPRRELQGPRPSALKVNKDSHKIRKPPVAPPPHHPPPPQAPPQLLEHREPVIIYAVSPRVIHADATDFKKLVQHLTGKSTDGGASSSSAFAGSLSPAARVASIEQTSPCKDREITGADNNYDESNSFLGDFLGDTAVEMGTVPGILSPAPATLPAISPGFFSPSLDPFMMGYNMFIPSPSTLFSVPMVSPSPSSASCDLFNPFFDF